MFESAALPHDVSKEDFGRIAPKLQEELLDAQFELAQRKDRTILILINGSDGAGKGELLGRLGSWLDPHHLDTLSYGRPTQDERLRPYIWRYWRDMPARGRIGIVLGSWYHPPLEARAVGDMNETAFSMALADINRFETMLNAEGVILIKVWLFLDDKEARHRLKKVERSDGSLKRPVVIEWEDIDTKKERRKLAAAGLEMAEATSTGDAPWFVIAGDNVHYRDLAVGHLLLKALQRANALPQGGAPGPEPAPAPNLLVKGEPLFKGPSVISGLDLTRSLDRASYEAELRHYQRRLTELTTAPAFARRGLVLVFEGNDAAGKGGAILRIRQALDPRNLRVHGISAPTDEERARPYLWRFWRRLPMRGQTAVFDRSWYGRVLVERIEGFCQEPDWLRAYDEINDFERHLTDSDFTVVKFWLAISREEQMNRFKARENTPVKRYKITPEDWRNREKWDDYEQALNDMIDRTSTHHAPWTLVEANDKHFARVKVMRTLVEALES